MGPHMLDICWRYSQNDCLVLFHQDQAICAWSGAPTARSTVDIIV